MVTVLNHDVAWLLIAAGRMIAGGTYSADYFEINMPLAIAAYIPPHLFARSFGITLEQGLVVWISLLILQTILLCSKLGLPGRARQSSVTKTFVVIFGSWSD